MPLVCVRCQCGHVGAVASGALPRLLICIRCAKVARFGVEDEVHVAQPVLAPTPRAPRNKGKPRGPMKRVLVPGIERERLRAAATADKQNAAAASINDRWAAYEDGSILQSAMRDAAEIENLLLGDGADHGR